MSQYVGHLVRRGVQSAGVAIAKGGDKGEMPEVPTWGMALVLLTVLVFSVFISLLSYTLSDVVGTLTMIETPMNAIALPQSEEEADKKDGLLAEPASLAVKPITAKIRTTIKHITAIGGRWARWRAIVPAILYSMVFGTIYQVLDSVLPRIPARRMLLETVVVVILARFHMAWTHAVISMPSSLRWYQRIAPFKSMKQLWIPSAVNVVAVYAVVYLTFGFAYLIGACNSAMLGKSGGEPMPKAWWGVFVIQGLAIFAFAVVMSLFVILPAAVTLARVEASMLPEDQETIVPFDRSFGGKVVPEAYGGTGAIGFIDAWRTFDWEARRRLVKLFLKNILIMTAVVITAFHVIGFELWAIMGPELGKFLAVMQKQSAGL